jgi:two-component system OmpR family sensor kinase/two-component system sensor histidine kinase BaeS
MRNSLLLKLLGAFALVIAINALAISLLTSTATRSAFDLYTTRSGQIWGERIARYLAEYYAETNSWEGVDAILKSGLSPQELVGGGENRGGQGRGNGAANAPQGPGTNLFLLGQRLILADANGIVVSDTTDELVGQPLPASDLEAGAAVMVNSVQVGTLLVTPESSVASDTLAEEFLSSVNRAIIGSAIISGGIALLIGGLLFFQIIRPLRKLNAAAAAVSSGDLKQRVEISSRDEVGELGTTFNQMAESLSRSEQQRQNFMADVAHELRTPLAAMQGTLEGIQDGILPMDETQVADLYAETMLLNRLVGDLRLLSLAETGQLELHRIIADPREVIDPIVERMKPQANQKNIRLTATYQEPLPRIRVDTDRIAQVLTNLIGNAIRYTPEGGEVTIQISHDRQRNQVVVSVTDTGSGIEPQDLPFIFDRFYRADKSRARSSGGSGLGLAIVRQLVEAHGGNIIAESPVFHPAEKAGFGARFILTLPIELSTSVHEDDGFQSAQ